MRALARNVAIVLLTLAVLALLWQFRSAAVLFLLSLWFAGTARPVVDRFSAVGLPRGLAILMVYLVILAIVAGLIIAVGPTLLAELQLLTDRFVSTYGEIWAQWPEGTVLQQFLIERLPPPERLYSVFNVGTENPIVDSLLTFFFGSVAVLGQVVLAIVLSIYWTSDRVRFERLWLSLMPADMRMRARSIYRQLEDGVGTFTRSILIQALAAGILLGIGYAVLGVPYATLLALVGAVAWVLPWIGLFVTLVVVVAAAAPVSIGLAVMGGLFTLTVYVVLIYVVEPRLFPRERFSLLLKLILVIALGSEYGIIGIIIAPPLSAALQLIGRNVTRLSAPAVSQETIRHIADLDQHLSNLAQILETMPAEKAQPIENMMERLNRLVEKARELVEEERRPGGEPTGGDSQAVAGRVPSR